MLTAVPATRANSLYGAASLHSPVCCLSQHDANGLSSEADS